MYTLLSTVVAPRFERGCLNVEPISVDRLRELLPHVTRNLCGHPATDALLREVCPELPPAERGFWAGDTPGIAVRPRGGVRGAAGADVPVTMEAIEAAIVTWTPN